jgi:hypothetical protein
VLLNPQVADPSELFSDLVVAGDTTLRVSAGPGYGSVGEPMSYTFSDDGQVLSISGPGGLTMWPIDAYPPK